MKSVSWLLGFFGSHLQLQSERTGARIAPRLSDFDGAAAAHFVSCHLRNI